MILKNLFPLSATRTLLRSSATRRTTNPRRPAIVFACALVALITLLEAMPAEARRGGSGRGRGAIGLRGPIVSTPYFGYFGPYASPFYHGYGLYNRHGVHRGPEGGINLTQARLMGWGAIDLAVKPGKAEVWVDGKYLGTVRDFDGYPTYLWLEEGSHRVTLYRGGFETYQEDISITPGVVIELKMKMTPGEAQPPLNATEPTAQGTQSVIKGAKSKTS